MTHTTEHPFPFSALAGQQDLQTALVLSAIDPMIGGVLIEGPRGTAKSTAARGLADLVEASTFINLPLTTSEEQLIGSLNIESALQAGKVEFKPGLLAAAHEGVLYVDEVNLLADHLVDALLDVSASGINRIEHDGISHQHPARFVLIGTMNPEEGQLRPQLLDRFGLYVQLPQSIDPSTRQHIVKARLAFDNNPQHFIARFARQQQALKKRLQQARENLHAIELHDAVINTVAEICHQANVEGMRADLSLLRAARAHAAWQAHTEISDADIEAVTAWVLTHRQQQTGPPAKPSPPASQPPDVSEHHELNVDNSQQQHFGAMPPQSPQVESSEVAAITNLKPLSGKK
ncbi:MAG: AAA family ATPase [Pseudomonadota bacterium]